MSGYRACFQRLGMGIAITAIGMPATAQIAQAPAVPQTAPVVPPPVQPTQTIPAPVAIPAPVVLPQLSEAQHAQLADLIAKNAVTQGLRERARPAQVDLDNDGLVRAALDHARAVHSGRLDQADFLKVWGIRPQPYDPLPAFAAAVRSDTLANWIRTLGPPWAGYDALVAGLDHYRTIAANGGWQTLASGPDLTLNATGARVIALRKRLAIEDKAVSVTGDRFDQALLDAVRRAQRRYGLNPSGIVSTQTLAMLNAPVEARIRQIMANMERWRWLPSTLEQNRIQVNIAAAVLTLFDGDNPVMSMKAVTGRPGDETPMLVSQIHSIVLNPPWNVPTSIATRELWPKERANPGYLRRAGFRVIDNGDGSKRLQQSSEKSALGRFKFDFPNEFAVYLHDTPAQAGFAKFDRLASHGCVRLEKPEALATRLLATNPEWQVPEIKATVAGGKTVRAQMADSVAVYLLYWTAFANPDGTVSFRDDPYSWDGVLADKIEARSAAQAVAAR
ncbi:Peptidoglycan-binding protein [Sphingomonas sp. EC-HK361]|nr:Peptidoglycan-binding protein [Sphingomonas sp. EC-HK361]